MPVFHEYAAIIKTLLGDRNAYDAFEASRGQWLVSDRDSPFGTRANHIQKEGDVAENENLLLRLQTRIDNVDRARLSYESQLYEPGLLDHATQFYLLLVVWLTRLADPEKKGFVSYNRAIFAYLSIQASA